MAAYTKRKGLIAATLTPMHNDGSVNYDLIPEYCRNLAERGIHQIFLNGTAAEHASLTVRERQLIAERWAALRAEPERSGLRYAIAHCGAGNLRDSIELAKHAAALDGVDAIAAVAPTYFKCDTVDSLVQYMAAIAAAAPDKPFLYYHIPMVTGIAHRLTDVFKAAHGVIPTLCGAKFTGTDLYDATEAMRLFDRRYDVIIGAETMLLAALSMGIESAIGVSFFGLGPMCNKICSAYDAGDMAAAQREQYKVQDFWSAMHRCDTIHGIIASFKHVLSCEMGRFGPPRLPIVPLTDEQKEAILSRLS